MEPNFSGQHDKVIVKENEFPQNHFEALGHQGQSLKESQVPPGEDIGISGRIGLFW